MAEVSVFSDALPSLAVATWLETVKQMAFHKLTTDNILGPGGEGWGFDCTRLLGSRAADLASKRAVLASLLQDDDRVEKATVTFTDLTAGSLRDLRVDVHLDTVNGPVDLSFSALNKTLFGEA